MLRELAPDPAGPSSGPNSAPRLAFMAPLEAEYRATWDAMNLELAQSILETGFWSGFEVTPIQRQAAKDFVHSKAADGPRQTRIGV